jgi:hypothetical protein
MPDRLKDLGGIGSASRNVVQRAQRLKMVGLVGKKPAPANIAMSQHMRLPLCNTMANFTLEKGHRNGDAEPRNAEWAWRDTMDEEVTVIGYALPLARGAMTRLRRKYVTWRLAYLLRNVSKSGHGIVCGRAAFVRSAGSSI